VYALNKLSPGPQTEVGIVGATARVDNHTEEVIPAEEDKIDGSADVGVDTAHGGDVDNSKTAITPTDRGDPVELIRVQDRASVSMEASTDGPMVTMCTQVRNVSHRKLDTSIMPPLQNM